MSAWYRAAVAVSLLAGFFVVVLSIITTMITLTVWSTETGNKFFQNGTPTTFLAMATTAMILVVFLALFVSRRERAPISGVSLDDSQAPALWALVRELAASAGTRPPDRILLTAEANAGVLEDTTCWGLLPGVRHRPAQPRRRAR